MTHESIEIPATRISRFALGKAQPKICRELRNLSWNLMVCARGISLRVSFGEHRLYERVVQKDRERKKKKRERKGEGARERDWNGFSPRKGSNLVANQRKEFETGIGPRTNCEIPLAISCLSLPFI